MVVRIFLFDSGSNSREQVPDWWRNFVHDTLPIRRLQEGSENRRLLNVALLPWHAQYWMHVRPDATPTRRYIDFYDEAAYHWFLLKWS
jgi:hypothetical protein